VWLLSPLRSARLGCSLPARLAPSKTPEPKGPERRAVHSSRSKGPTGDPMMYRIAIAALAICLASPAVAQPAGWRPTGGWQCGPHVRITTAIDGSDGIDFYVTGAWFDNHYTLRRGQLYYNGVPCASFGFPFGPPPRVSSKQCVPDTKEAQPGDRICE
jgi:hypothetical protein